MTEPKEMLVEPMRIKYAPTPTNVLSQISGKHLGNLTDYLVSRLHSGVDERNKRLPRMYQIDKLISLWRKHNASDTKRIEAQQKDGKQTAVAANMPLLASHLEDLVAFLTETLAPMHNPFVTNSADEAVKKVVARLGEDVVARNYYLQAMLAIRSLVKYNIGGVHVRWEQGITGNSTYGISAPGNSYRALDMHNTLWDPAIKNPNEVSSQAEWAALVTTVNRVSLLRGQEKNGWMQLDLVLNPTPDSKATTPKRIWVDPSAAIPTEDGADALSLSDDDSFDYNLLGLGEQSQTYTSVGEGVYELTTMYAWILPNQFGLLSTSDKEQIVGAGKIPASFIELWEFTLLNNSVILNGKPHNPRAKSLAGESPVIPTFMSNAIVDQVGTSQRSSMEMIAPFQLFMTTLYNTAVDAVRSGVYGSRYYDPSIVSAESLDKQQNDGGTGWVPTKRPGIPPGNGIYIDRAGGQLAGEAIALSQNMLGVKNSFFPNQAMPAQVAGIDRAVSSQITAFVHGAQRSVRMMLRILDSSLFLPARLETARNLFRHDNLEATPDIPDEKLTSALGSGLESLESERIVDALMQLLNRIIQSQEATQAFDVPAILGFLGNALRLPVDMSVFYREQPQTPPPAGNQPPPAGQP